MTVGLVATVLGFALIVAGVAFMFWPASLVVAGAGLLYAGLTFDWTFIRERSRRWRASSTS